MIAAVVVDTFVLLSAVEWGVGWVVIPRRGLIAQPRRAILIRGNPSGDKRFPSPRGYIVGFN